MIQSTTSNWKPRSETVSNGYIKRIHGLRIHLLSSLLLLMLLPAGAEELQAERPYQIEVSKGSRELRVMQGEQMVTSFHISYGMGGKGDKSRQGDNKTPVGNYRVMNFKLDSKFYLFMHLDYPNLVDAWHGYQNGVISAEEFRGIMGAYHRYETPPQDTPLGGYIGIHGIGEYTPEKVRSHEMYNWTEGCIALRNEEINELKKYISIGTRVVISD